MKKKIAQELFEKRRKRFAVSATLILNALKYRGMVGMKQKIIELTEKK